MIGIVGPDSEAARLAGAIDDAGGAAQVGSAATVAGDTPAVAVAIGEAAVVDLVRAGIDAPVLPVDAGVGLGSASLDAARGAVDRLLDGAYDTRRHPVLAARIDGERVGRALFDAMLVTSEPGRISEYRVESGDGDDQFRADGVVVATPAGSHGYANAAGGPLLDPGSDAVAIVPVAPFAIRTDRRVAGLAAPVDLTVERDEAAVSLLLDGRERRGIPHREPITVGRDGALETVVL